MTDQTPNIDDFDVDAWLSGAAAACEDVTVTRDLQLAVDVAAAHDALVAAEEDAEEATQTGQPNRRRLAAKEPQAVADARAALDALRGRAPESWVTVRVSTLSESARQEIIAGKHRDRSFTLHALAATATVRPAGAPAEAGKKLTVEQWERFVDVIGGQFAAVDAALARVTFEAVVTPDFSPVSSDANPTS